MPVRRGGIQPERILFMENSFTTSEPTIKFYLKIQSIVIVWFSTKFSTFIDLQQCNDSNLYKAIKVMFTEYLRDFIAQKVAVENAAEAQTRL